MYTRNPNGDIDSYNTSHVSSVTKVRGALLQYISSNPDLHARLGALIASQIGKATLQPRPDIYSYIITFSKDDLREMGLRDDKHAVMAHVKMTAYNCIKDFYYQTKHGYLAARFYLDTGTIGEVTTALEQQYEREFMSVLTCLGNVLDLCQVNLPDQYTFEIRL